MVIQKLPTGTLQAESIMTMQSYRAGTLVRGAFAAQNERRSKRALLKVFGHDSCVGYVIYASDVCIRNF